MKKIEREPMRSTVCKQKILSIGRLLKKLVSEFGIIYSPEILEWP